MKQIKPNGVAFFSHDGILNWLIIETFLTHQISPNICDMFKEQIQ